MRLRDTSERALIARLARLLDKPAKGVTVAIGDDAALLARVGPEAVLTSDLLIQGVDFDLAWAPWVAVGHKAAAVNLSDLAAMGARPRGLLLSLALRPDDRVADVLGLVRALDRLGRRYGAPLVGGDLSRINGPLVVSVTAIGEVAREHALLRGCGRTGDIVLVSGTLGGAALGLRGLMQKHPVGRAFKEKQLRPLPRVELGLALTRARLVRSAADISDGLATDALHVAGPGCGVRLFADRLPLMRGAEALAARLGVDARTLALTGGEDFELVLAVAPKNVSRARQLAARLGVLLTPVGDVVRGRGVRVEGTRARDLRGFDHFAKA